MPFNGLRASPLRGWLTAVRGRLSEQTQAQDWAVCQRDRQAHGVSEARQGTPPGSGAAASLTRAAGAHGGLLTSWALSVCDSPTAGRWMRAEPRAAWRPRLTVRGAWGGPVSHGALCYSAWGGSSAQCCNKVFRSASLH